MKRSLLRWLRILGPGLVTGAADDDPSGISTYSVAGASTGYSLLWVAVLTTPMMAVVQGMCARIAMVTGVGLAAAIRKKYPRAIAYALAAVVVAANTLNVGADIGGMAASAQLVLGLPTVLWTLTFGTVLVLTQVYLSYRSIANILKWLTASLLAYVITAFVVHPPWAMILASTLVPRVHLSAQWLTTLVGVLGTTISPYLFFWQAAMCIEEEKSIGRKTIAQRKGATDREITEEMIDTNTGMAYSNLIFYFIVLTTAATLGAHGITNIATANDAARALQPLAGPFAAGLFALGMVGTGMLAVPTLSCSSAYVIADTLALRGGLNETPRRAWRFYAVIIIGTAIGVLMNLLHVDPIRALFWSAVCNGLASVPLLVFITLLANDKKMMGRWTNSPLANFWAWLTLILMAAAAVLMFVFWGK